MKMLINGQRTGASDGGVLEVCNPATGALLDTVPAATAADLERALTAAQKGWPAWAGTPLFERGAILRRFVRSIDEHNEELSLLLCREMGKPISEARNDFGSVKHLFNGFVEAANQLTGMTMPLGVQEGREKDFELAIREPLGVVACIIPFNAPLVLFSHKVAPALIAGNAVIVKPASDDPLVLLRLGELLWEAGVPGDVFQMITGSGAQIGSLLAGDPRVAKVSFTGSTEVGLAIARAAAANMGHTGLELGGNAPFVVMADADIDRAAAEAAAGRATYVTGQICNVAKRFLIHRSVKAAFTANLIDRLQKIIIGDPEDPATQMGTLISESAAREVERQVAHTVSQGAKLIYGGVRSGAYYTPAVLDEVTGAMDIAHDMEVFGPVFPLLTFDTLEEAIDLSNDTIFGLGAGIMTGDMSIALRFAMAVQAGSVIINGQSFYRSFMMPFGGYKQSGGGREGLTVSLQEVTQLKSIVFKNVL
ncbi:MAG: aldehyde dehydrogenase family protein [Gracilibacteraceae bacterium]|jgi:succinate-semialdehyde dehydrogenase/glutarate-semialdehyde dehydrogenase|nr:aldehyde dehydrogenase family protein [Gracilibacteraceae bacterium]